MPLISDDAKRYSALSTFNSSALSTFNSALSTSTSVLRVGGGIRNRLWRELVRGRRRSQVRRGDRSLVPVRRCPLIHQRLAGVLVRIGPDECQVNHLAVEDARVHFPVEQAVIEPEGLRT